MSKLRSQLSANTSNVVETKNLTDIKAKTGICMNLLPLLQKERTRSILL